MFRSKASRSKLEEDEEAVPLAGFVDGDAGEDVNDDDRFGDALTPHAHAAAAPRKLRASPLALIDSPLFRRALLLFVLALAALRFVDWLYSDPERWSTSWKDHFLPAAKLEETSDIIEANGRRFRGNVDNVMVSFKSMPYARPPIGALRFKAPQKLPKPALNSTIDTVIDARTYDQGCPRANYNDPETHIGNEDCLTLNVHVPRRRPKGKLLPVMVWIHGGGFYAGASHEERYNPDKLIARGTNMNQPFVFVSLNYRLNILGFSAEPPTPGPKLPGSHAHIPIRPPDSLDLNIGLKDQLMAMHWVHDWISSFGGDPTKVTLVGHSAGAMSVGLHQLYSPSYLFRGAFMLSGAPTSFPVPWPHDATARTLHPLPGHAGCPPPQQRKTPGPPVVDELVECLRKLPIDKLMQVARVLGDRAPVNGFFPWLPVLEGEWGVGPDGEWIAGSVQGTTADGQGGVEGAGGGEGRGGWLDRRPSERIIAGTFSKVPVVMGSVLDEGTRFTSDDMDSEGYMLDGLKEAFAFTYGAIEDILDPIFEYYPDDPTVGSPYNTGEELFGLSREYKRAASLYGDILFQAPRRHFLRETPKDWGEPSWNYQYLEPKPGADKRFGVGHSADLDSWFGRPADIEDPDKAHLSRHMTAYLINFVANLDPNGPGLRKWPKYGIERTTLQLARRNISLTHDNDRLEAMRFININNPLFAR